MGLVNFCKTLWNADRKMASLICSNTSFRLFERLGVHVSPIHFYSPIPDLREVLERECLWSGHKNPPGVSLNPDGQLTTMRQVIASFMHECDFPSQESPDHSQYHTSNVYFGYVSASAMHAFIRHFKPRNVIEVGSGYSTRVIAAAIGRNAAEGREANLLAIDPHPSEALQRGFPNLSKVISDRVENLPTSLFESLVDGDLLSIDSTHALRLGGDVQYLYLDILPRLRPGVVVHIHDIFIPFEYPREWLVARRFWTEQYILQAFLACNTEFEVLWGQRMMEQWFPDDYSQTFRGRLSVEENNGSYSFWMRRKM